jgi:DNA transposition AAA+ family ATPase
VADSPDEVGKAEPRSAPISDSQPEPAARSADAARPPTGRGEQAPPGQTKPATGEGDGPDPSGNGHFETKEHKLFREFADAVRRECYIGLCYGSPGVGKSESAKKYANWDLLQPHMTGNGDSPPGNEHPPPHALSARAILYTPAVDNNPARVAKELGYLHDRLAWTVELMLNPTRSQSDNNFTEFGRHAELIVVDEAERLKTRSLEQLRDHHDRTGIGVILIGMPGIEKRLARYPQFFSRVGFVHHYRPMSPDEQAFVLARHWPHLHLDDTGDYATTEAIAAITRITGGNFRLTVRLVAQIERILNINQLATVTKEVVEEARKYLVIGII